MAAAEAFAHLEISTGLHALPSNFRRSRAPPGIDMEQRGTVVIVPTRRGCCPYIFTVRRQQGPSVKPRPVRQHSAQRVV
ncbi:hypothetical protein LWP59_37755 [Amycolatopsis acidiphila]|uniref:Uncharacterized protein n=1 Tax=Amycolatopsis acidiphila TaxID=715473 RepID=A0A558A7R6_9PSEU|nr:MULTISPECIES: hypothetical protein [Amycolatopsis]TVT20286.1 hypothetical protein FNH06_21000 [Amycolatopsis acidiphila]UIJ59703.1 hypothetical protein LWP59_37755 [Amycolatopsis acidiphila]